MACQTSNLHCLIFPDLRHTCIQNHNLSELNSLGHNPAASVSLSCSRCRPAWLRLEFCCSHHAIYVNLWCLVSQGIAATYLRCGKLCQPRSFTNFIPFITVKQFCIFVKIWPSCHQVKCYETWCSFTCVEYVLLSLLNPRVRSFFPDRVHHFQWRIENFYRGAGWLWEPDVN